MASHAVAAAECDGEGSKWELTLGSPAVSQGVDFV